MKNSKKMLFTVTGFRNVYWDDTPLEIACELFVPDKYAGNQPVCILSHGSGGLGNDTELFVRVLSDNGIATLCVDSFTGRNMSNISWNDMSGYISPRARAYETVEAYKFLVENQETIFANLDINKVAFAGFSWGADSIANIIAHYSDSIPQESFFALCYGNLWPFEPEYFKAQNFDVTVYHGLEDNWTSPERTKIFAQKTNSEFVGFAGVTHGFCKEGYEDEIIKDVIVNYNAEFPVPTSVKEVFAWIQKGKVWKDTDWMRVDTSMTYDAMASEKILNDIIAKLK